MLLRSNRLIEKIETHTNTNHTKQTKHTKNDIEKTPYSISEFTSQFFDDSSVAWKMNKIQNKNATYEYRCAFCYTNKRCRELPFDQLYCKKHINYTHK